MRETRLSANAAVVSGWPQPLQQQSEFERQVELLAADYRKAVGVLSGGVNRLREIRRQRQRGPGRDYWPSRSE